MRGMVIVCSRFRAEDTEGNPVNATNTKILGNFGNLGGQVWWKLETNPNI